MPKPFPSERVTRRPMGLGCNNLSRARWCFEFVAVAVASLEFQSSVVRRQLMPHLFRLNFVSLVLYWHLMTTLLAVQLRLPLEIWRSVFLAADIFKGTIFWSTGMMLVAKNGKRENKRNDTEWNDDADDNFDFG